MIIALCFNGRCFCCMHVAHHMIIRNAMKTKFRLKIKPWKSKLCKWTRYSISSILAYIDVEHINGGFEQIHTLIFHALIFLHKIHACCRIHRTNTSPLFIIMVSIPYIQHITINDVKMDKCAFFTLLNISTKYIWNTYLNLFNFLPQ